MMEHMSGTLSSRWAGFEPRAKALYVSSFPKVERFPYGLICAVAYLPGFHFRTWYIDGKFIGLTYTLTRHSMSVIYYLAVVEEERGKEGLDPVAEEENWVTGTRQTIAGILKSISL